MNIIEQRVSENMSVKLLFFLFCFVPEQIRTKSLTSSAGKEPALQLCHGHFIVSDNIVPLGKEDFMNMYAAQHVNYTRVKLKFA